MVDMTLCSNDKCPARDLCWRYTCEPDEYQSYSEFKWKGRCEHFIDIEKVEDDRREKNER